MVCPTAEPTATPAAVVAICAISPGCLGAGAATAEGGAAAGTAARGAGAGDAALLGGARLRGHREKHHSIIIIIIVMTPNHAAAGQERTVPAVRNRMSRAAGDNQGAPSATRGAAQEAPRITLGLHTPLLHAEGMNSVLW